MTSPERLRIITYMVLITIPLATTTHVSVTDQDKCTCHFINGSLTLVIKCDRGVSRDEVSKCLQSHKTAKELVFTDSFITEIPVEIKRLHHLTNLDVSRNELRALDLGQIQHVCKRLTKLTVDNNNIEVLERGSMDCLESLTTFSIVNNSLSVIENGTFNANLKRLEFIYLMHNSLATLDASAVYLPNLRTNSRHIRVNATWNNISYITNNINISIMDFEYRYSFYLVLTHNNFTGIDLEYYFNAFHITNKTQLLRLWNSGFDIRFNPFICDCAMEPFAEKLREFRDMDPDNPVFSITCQKPFALSGMTVYKVPLNQFNCSILQQCPVGCSCVQTVHLKLITVSCDNNFTLSSLPDQVPNSDNVQIHVKTGTFRQLTSRYYLTNTTLLDVSGCALEMISNDSLIQLANIETVYLHDNSLTAMPRRIELIHFDGLQALTLRGNPFSCDCHSLWFKQWLLRNKPMVTDVTRVLCASGPGKGRPIIDVKDSDFKCVHHITVQELITAVFSVAFVMVLILLTIHFNRKRIHVLLIAYFGVNCFRRKAFGEFQYDVFISHSSLDDDWVLNTLMANLESQQPPYKIFFDERDFQPGKTIVYNVIRAIELSRTTLLVLTNNFLRSQWCMMEFKEAHLKLLTENISNIIVIVMEELDKSLMGDELLFYLKTNVYIDLADKLFWPKILQALPMANSTPDEDMQRTEGLSERSPLMVN